MGGWPGGGGREAGELGHWDAGSHPLISFLHCRVGFGQDTEWSKEVPLARLQAGRAVGAGGAGGAVGAGGAGGA